MDGLPALVVPDLFLGGLDLADRGGELRRLVLELAELDVQVGRGRAVGHLDVGRLDLPLVAFLSGLPAQCRPEQRAARDATRAVQTSAAPRPAAASSPALSNDAGALESQ